MESQYRKYSYRKKARIRLKRMNNGYQCDEEYEKIVVPYWKKYGLKPKKNVVSEFLLIEIKK